MIRQGKDPHIVPGQGNTIGVKESQEKEQANESEIYLLSQSRVSQEHQANSRHIYPENLVQTLAGPIRGSSVSMNPHEPCLVY